MRKNVLGRTGYQISPVVYGAIINMSETPEEAARQVAHAISRDVNYFDVAPSYGDAQQLLGPALAPYRKDVFLACKTGERTKEGAAASCWNLSRRCRQSILMCISCMR